MRKARLFWWIAAAWAVVIFFLSSIPGKAMPPIPALQYDKVIHALVYFVLGVLFCLALRQTSSMPTRRIVALAAFLSLAYGLSDEFHQLFVPGRSADLYDALADGIGGLLGASFAVMLPFAKPRALG
jgi:VanZ family protein